MGETEELRKRLRACNEFFKSMVDLVPPAFYFDSDVTQQLSEERGKQAEAKLKKLKKAGDVSAKALLRRARFDPAENLTVTELASQMESTAAVGGDETEEEEDRPKKKAAVAVASAATAGDRSGSHKPAVERARLTLEELRDKLHRRIEELRGKRHAMTADEFLEKKKLRRKESKVKLKIRKRAERENVSQGKQAKNESAKAGGADAAPRSDLDGSKLAFSKFEFSSSAAKARPHAGHKSVKDLLRKAEREQEALAQLKATDVSKAAEVEVKRRWAAALDKAKGVKVRDDPAMLKKSIKLQERRKEKSRKEWQSRVESVEQRQKARQDKRQRNIQARKQSKTDNKVKRLRSKGRLVSGF